MTPARRHVLATLVVACSLSPRGAALAADDYPKQPVKLIVAAAAGGPDRRAGRHRRANPDRQARSTVRGRKSARRRRRPRRAVVASAPPDGYTLLVGNTSTLAVIPAVFTSAGYDPVKDFMPIVRITEGFQILVVLPDSRWKRSRSSSTTARPIPERSTTRHTGAGGLPHLAGELFMLRSGAKLTGVSYRSGGEANTGVLSKAVDATFENIAIVRQLIARGQVSRARRAEQDPHVAAAGIVDHGGGRRCRCDANTFFGWWRRPAHPPASSRSSAMP